MRANRKPAESAPWAFLLWGGYILAMARTLHHDLILIPRPRTIEIHPEAGTRNGACHERLDASIGHAQGYTLETARDGTITIVGNDPAGVFYGRQTLKQIRRQFENKTLPVLRIEDYPDFPVRGVMLDISRDKVPTMQTLYGLIDQLAELKINQLQLYTEHTFAYAGHETVWKDASPMTADEIQALDQYCAARFIELVPNQNSFGHLERWFKHPQYHHLAEQPAGFVFPWGNRMPTGFSLNPTDPRSLEFIEGLFDQLLPNFSSRLFNVGCDETFDIGLGASKEAVKERGRERVYLEFLLKIHNAVARRGHRMMFWGDIILHNPELIRELPRDLIALNWGYEADHPFEKETQEFQKAGVPFYVCPGTSSWCSIAGRTDNAIANLKSAAQHGLANGASGYLITDWGDHGHLQYLPVSYIGLAAGAAYAWCFKSNHDFDVLQTINQQILHDHSATAARVLADLGNVYQAVNEPLANGSRLFWTLVNGPDRRKLYEHVTPAEYQRGLDRIDAAMSGLQNIRMQRGDAGLIVDEIRNAADMLRHACHHGMFLNGQSQMSKVKLADSLKRIAEEHKRLWLSRNREGGLADSVARLTSALHHYNEC